MNNFFSSQLPPSFYVYVASNKSQTFQLTNKSYNFSNWLTINENVDLRDFQVGLAQIIYGDSFVALNQNNQSLETLTTPRPPTKPPTRPPTTTERPGLFSALSTLLMASKLHIVLEKKSGIQVNVEKLPRQQLAEFLLALFGMVDTNVPGLTLQSYHNSDGSKNTQLEFTDSLSEGYNVQLDPNLASVLGFRDTIFAPGTHRSPGIQSQSAFDKLADNKNLKLQRFKWTQHKIPISDRADELADEDEESALNAWLEICGETLVAGGYDVSFAMDPTNLNHLHVVLETGAVDFRFQLPEQINRLMGLKPEYMFHQTVRITLPVYTTSRSRESEAEDNPPSLSAKTSSKGMAGDFPLVYVTCDLVEVSQLGEELHQLLRIFPRNEGILKQHHQTFDSVFYQTLISGHPKSVSIQLFNQKWEHLPDFGTDTIVILHFRRV